MEFEYSEERRMLKESVERFVADRYGFAQRRPIAESSQRFSPEVWAALAGFGWLGLPLPEAHGGFGGAALDTGIVMEGFGRRLVLEPYLSTVVLGAGLIEAAGTPAQHAQWLPRIAAGELRIALAHVESLYRALDATPATRAVRADGRWTLDGSKRLVLDAPGADLLIVSAMAEGAVALFTVPRSAAGLTVKPYETLDARLGADVVLAGVRVDDAQRLAGVADAGPALAAAVDRAIAATCWEAVGCMQVLLDYTVAYTKTRVQFDRPIASNQVLRHRMVDMAIHCEEARAMAWRASLQVNAAPALRAREVSGARSKVARAARFVAESAVQLHGAMGVTEELNVGAYVKRLMAIDRTFGTSAEHNERIAALRSLRAAA